MTFSGLKDQVAYWLDDLNFGYFTDVQVGVWLNNAQKEVQKRLLKAGQNYYLKSVQTTLVINQREYVLPDDFKKVHRLEIVTSGTNPNETVQALVPITTNQQDAILKGSGMPSCYFYKRNRLVILKAPDTAYVMRMDYSYQVADMTLATDVPDVPESYVELLPLLAAQDGFIKDGRVSALLEKKIKEYESDFDTDAQERNEDVSRSINDVGSGDGLSF